MTIRVGVVTISDSAAAGAREDRSGPAIQARVTELGWSVVETRLVEDSIEQIASTLSALADSGTIDAGIDHGRHGRGSARRNPRSAARRSPS